MGRSGSERWAEILGDRGHFEEFPNLELEMGVLGSKNTAAVRLRISARSMVEVEARRPIAIVGMAIFAGHLVILSRCLGWSAWPAASVKEIPRVR